MLIATGPVAVLLLFTVLAGWAQMAGGSNAAPPADPDARGNSASTNCTLTNDTWGTPNRLRDAGPTYAGASSANVTATTYSPDINRPTTTDALNQNGITNLSSPLGDFSTIKS